MAASFTFTCITCRVAFMSADNQRQHYKTDWHRYNLKRKVAELPPVIAGEFHRRVLLQREKANAENENHSVFCSVCRKTFNTQNSYENHLKSKKRKCCTVVDNQVTKENDTTLVSNLKCQTTKSNSPQSVALQVQDRRSKSLVENGIGIKNDAAVQSSDSEIEVVDSDEWEDGDGVPIPVGNCLFCSHHSDSMEESLKHMTVFHSFFIPDVEYLIDIDGLLTYLGQKVGQGYMCLWCNERGKGFYSVYAVQKHMQDKGHCKLLHEGETLAEYSDFYDYSSSYPDQSENPDDEVSIPVLDDTDLQLVLPSGATIGHRSLFKYYRQNLNPTRAVQPQRCVNRILYQYRALGWNGTDKISAERKAKDIRYMKRIQSKYATKLAVKNNKMQTHYRPQVMF